MHKKKCKIKELLNEEGGDSTNVFSIHTVEFRTMISREDYYSIKNGIFICGYGNIRYYEDSEGIIHMYSDLLRSMGINKFTLYIRKEKGCPKGYYITAVVNLRLLFNDTRYPFLCIARIEYLSDVYDRIVLILQAVGFPKRIAEEVYYSRIDYCCNVEFETEEQVDLMLEILDKGRVNKFFMKDCNEFHDNEVKYDTKSFSLSMYKKGGQMRQKNEYFSRKYSEEEIQMADKVLRIEFRAERAQLYVQREKYGITEKELVEKAPIIGQAKFNKFYRNLCGTGRFYKMKYAKKMINQSGYTNSTKKTMIHIIQIVSRSGLLGVVEELGKNKFLYYMNKFNKLNLSPICIPTEFKCDEMNSLFWYMNHCNVNQR